MKRYERLNAILELLAEDSKLDVDAAAPWLGASEATIRRDLKSLAEQQLLTRTHGGAVANSTSYAAAAFQVRPPSAGEAADRAGRGGTGARGRDHRHERRHDQHGDRAGHRRAVGSDTEPDRRRGTHHRDERAEHRLRTHRPALISKSW